MIAELKTTPPFIDFGFGVTQKEVAAGETFTVWLATLYNREEYTFLIPTIAGVRTVTKISNYEFQVVYHNPGTYEVQMHLNSKTSKSLESNILTLNVI